MWYFMAGMESMYNYIDKPCDFGLMTFWGISSQAKFEEASKNINHILMDSGAYSFRVSGKKMDFDTYCNNYIDFVKYNSNDPKIVGFFELDIDSLVGYEKVLEYRRRLEEVSDKIIPVWHQNRGIKEFHNMCEKYKGKRVAVACVGWHDMKPSQLNLFINTAHKYGCKIHILGMTSKEVINSINLGLEDSFDSVSWALAGAFVSIKLNLKNDNIYSLDFLHGIPNCVTTHLSHINYVTFRNIQSYYKNIDNSKEVK